MRRLLVFVWSPDAFDAVLNVFQGAQPRGALRFAGLYAVLYQLFQCEVVFYQYALAACGVRDAIFKQGLRVFVGLQALLGRGKHVLRIAEPGLVPLALAST